MSKRVLLAMVCLVLVGCSFKATNEVIQELPSPDGRMRLVLFCRNAGATTGFNTQMSVLGVKEKLPGESGGNAFIIDKGHAQARWREDGSILVRLDQGCRVFKKDLSVKGITIEYLNQ